MSDDLLDLAESIFAGAATEGTGLDVGLWKTLEETGLARLTLAESAGGSGGTLTDAAAVLQAAGAHAARVPLIETDLLAAWLLHAHGIEIPDGPLTAVAADPSTGIRVPWARAASGVAVLTPTHVRLFTPDQLTITEGANLAEEPRDTVTVGGTGAVSVEVRPGTADELRLRAAFGRAQLLAGAARGALARTVRYAGERVQFGRPIGKFQAVQQQLALAAAEVAAAGAAASAAASTAERDGFTAGDGSSVASTAFAVAAAKARTSEAAGEVARIAHQVHGAIGFTREHDLRLLTTRLWAWRDEDGNEAHWQTRLGATVLAAGADALWPMVTGTP